ncbi:hypothetical protein FHS81_001894 [Pseudochelatococcus contaminans]|uniref:Uncharacterized protein n=1 Tax=Pseudochelatococcus contaminans TaxID=1538103 RepID=A0A7W5Z5B2_9HYPH|nr:hypothetical protein [Pseudochelatococcus contaminans]
MLQFDIKDGHHKVNLWVWSKVGKTLQPMIGLGFGAIVRNRQPSQVSNA